MTKKLIDRLEELADEMKVIVHQLRVPSTVSQEEIDKAEWQRGEVEGVIEFEGQQYKKVDREAREGDVIMYSEIGNGWANITPNKPYKVYEEKGPIRLLFARDNGNPCRVYGDDSILSGLKSKNINVYELIVEDKPKIRGIAIEIDAPKSANQQRAEVIAKAKRFIKETKTSEFTGRVQMGVGLPGEGRKHTHYDVYVIEDKLPKKVCDVEFIVREEKRVVIALMRGVMTNKVYTKGIAKCMPTDVFNADIGKAIALGRALGLDVSEFENAVQPTEKVVGMKVVYNDKEKDYVAEIKPYDNSRWYNFREGTVAFQSIAAELSKIINDTNAEYEVNA